jgi:hypothetical protein
VVTWWWFGKPDRTGGPVTDRPSFAPNVHRGGWVAARGAPCWPCWTSRSAYLRSCSIARFFIRHYLNIKLLNVYSASLKIFGEHGTIAA